MNMDSLKNENTKRYKSVICSICKIKDHKLLETDKNVFNEKKYI